MKNKKIEKFMDDLQTPNVEVNQLQREFRLTLLNTKKSAILGGLLLLLPLLFLSGVIFKHYLGLDLFILTSVYEWIGEWDHRYGDSSILNWIIRALLLLGPLVAIAINALAILHIRYEKPSREIVMSIRLRWLNLLIIGICSGIFLLFFFYLVLENLHTT